VWLAAGVTDMRKGFDGLAMLVQQQLAAERRGKVNQFDSPTIARSTSPSRMEEAMLNASILQGCSLGM
jgi:transposase